MNIRGIIGTALIAGATLTNTSCTNQEAIDCAKSRNNLLEQVMQDKPQKELDSIKLSMHKGDAGITETQHKIDSIAFSDIFKGSQKAKDSAFVADYNKMMAITKTPVMHDDITGQGYKQPDAQNYKITDYQGLKKKLADVLTVKEMKNIEKNPVIPENGGKGYYQTDMQYLVDSVYHHKLFEKYGLLNDSTMKDFKKICNKVRP